MVFSAGAKPLLVKSDSTGRPEYPRMQTVGQKENEMKNLIASGMTLPQGALGIAQALADMGGTDKDFTSLIGNRPLCDEVAQTIMRRHFVTVDCSFTDVYPDWVKRKVYPDLAHIYCASEFDVRTLERKIIISAQGSITTGANIYHYINDRLMIRECLGLCELKAIQKKGPVFFKEHFDGLIVIGWQSLVEHNNGTSCVPGLYSDRGDLLIEWYRLDEEFGPGRPVISFKDQ